MLICRRLLPLPVGLPAVGVVVSILMEFSWVMLELLLVELADELLLGSWRLRLDFLGPDELALRPAFEPLLWLLFRSVQLKVIHNYFKVTVDYKLTQ